MSVRKLTFGLLAAVALLAGQRSAVAQEHLPVADPFMFDPDFRWFEPVSEMDLLDMKPKKRANVGWFGSYDRMIIAFSRPDVDILSEPNSNDYADGFDSGWGNRIDFGYMLEEDNGWLATYIESGGPEAFDSLVVERVNRLNEEDLAGPGDDEDGNFDQFGRILPSADRNLAEFNERVYELKDSINAVEFHSFEINKTWRLEPYHYGGILEPMIGLRYMGVDDHWQRESYSRGLDIDTNTIETLSGTYSTAENNAFGGQLGARYFKFQNRFILSADFRAFALQNWQNHRTVDQQITTTYDGIGIGAEVISEMIERNPLVYEDDSEFVVGFDVRANVAYQLTRQFQLQAGFQMIDMARGVWRGERINSNDQELVMIGGTFGFAYNR